MIDDIDSSSSTLRMLASQALKAWGTSAILKLLSDEDYVVRTLAARELHVRGSQEVFEHTLQLETGIESEKRELCAFILGQLGTPEMPFKLSSFPILRRLAADSDSGVRAAAVAALGHLCYAGMPPDVEKLLQVSASDENPEVRACTAISLGNASASNETLRTLEILLEDSDSQVRGFAEVGLEILQCKKES